MEALVLLIALAVQEQVLDIVIMDVQLPVCQKYTSLSVKILF